MSPAHRVKVLLATREPLVASAVARALEDRYEMTERQDARAALEALNAEAHDLVLLDLELPESEALDLPRRVSEDPAHSELIVIASPAARGRSAEALALGASGWLITPLVGAEVSATCARAVERRRSMRESDALRERLGELGDLDALATEYAPLRAVLAMVERVARADSPVLLIGEPGTGKSLVARRMHRASPRSSGTFVALNAASLPPARLERAIFGDGGVEGVLERGSGGTVLLENIGVLDARLQGKLMRALEQGAFYRATGTQQVRLDSRVIAASSEALEPRVAAGTFRGDLYYRINTVSILLPPLRERVVDIPALARLFLVRAGGGRTLSSGALDALRTYPWPGNVRELRLVIERAALVASGAELRAADLGLAEAALAAPLPVRREAVLGSLEEVERRHIDAVLRHVNWHQGRAAAILGVSAKTLYRKIRTFGLRRPRHSSAPPRP